MSQQSDLNLYFIFIFEESLFRKIPMDKESLALRGFSSMKLMNVTLVICNDVLGPLVMNNTVDSLKTWTTIIP